MQPENYWEMYDADVMVMPRRYGGLCMPVNEALGAGMPIIMPAISPNKDWLPKEWLTPAELKFTTIFKRGNLSIDVYLTEPMVLAKKIDQFANDPDFYQEQVQKARKLAKEYSWGTLKPLYSETFNNMLKL
jgi:glycosyltransferase involved in cell wall biosynthesis